MRLIALMCLMMCGVVEGVSMHLPATTACSCWAAMVSGLGEWQMGCQQLPELGGEV